MDDNIKIEHITNGRVSKSYESTVRKTFQYIIEWVLNKDDLFSTNNREDFGVLFQIKLDTLPFNIQLIEANKSYLKWMYSVKLM